MDLQINPDGLPDFVGADLEVADIDLPGDIVEAIIAQLAADGIDVSALTTFTSEQYALKIAEEAAGFIGVSRASNLWQVARFLGLFNLPTRMDGKWVPFCAAGLSWAAVKAFCILSGIAFTADNAPAIFKSVLKVIKQRFFLPSPSCWAIEEDAQGRGTWISRHTPAAEIKKGYLVLYNWKGGLSPEHIGIVVSAEAGALHTIEFNTSDADNSNGGAVARRTRSYTCVVGYVKLY